MIVYGIHMLHKKDATIQEFQRIVNNYISLTTNSIYKNSKYSVFKEPHIVQYVSRTRLKVDALTIGYLYDKSSWEYSDSRKSVKRINDDVRSGWSYIATI